MKICSRHTYDIQIFKLFRLLFSSYFPLPLLLRDPLFRTISIASIYTRSRYLNYYSYESLGYAHRFGDGDGLGGGYTPRNFLCTVKHPSCTAATAMSCYAPTGYPAKQNTKIQPGRLECPKTGDNKAVRERYPRKRYEIHERTIWA